MSFTWTEYLALAEELSGGEPAATPSEEARQRSAISRAYYAAFHVCLDKFGSKIPAGSVNDIKSFIESNKQPYYVGQGRFYVVEWNGTPGSGQANYPSLQVTAQGIMPLYQRCVHLGCRVPFCQQSQWFECPCHGSKYNDAGEYQLGPAPRGMDRFMLTIEGDQVIVDTSGVILGPPRGTNTINEPAQGPFCVAPG